MKNSILFLVIIMLIGCGQKREKTNSQTIQLLVGTYTSESSEGIYAIDFNTSDGSLSNQRLVAKVDNPSYLAKSSDGKFIFAVNEKDPGVVSSFKWNDDNTELVSISEKASGGIHPCYISLNESENRVAVANYSSGNFTVYQVKNGALKISQTKNHKGSSVVKPNQDSPHAHCSKFSNDGKYLYVTDLGIDEVKGYPLDKNNELGESFTALKMDAGDGPRHFVFYPNNELVYIINELSSTITVALIDKETGVFSIIDKQSTLPSDSIGDSFCADIQITSDGKFLYASNRGHNSIAIFSIADNGTIQLLETEFVRGDWPRNFTLSPDEKFVLVANQKSNNITVFERDFKTGLLTFTGVDFKLSKPVCLIF